MASPSRVLIVDDEPDNIRALIRLLRKDFELVGLESPKEALKLLQNGERFDCLVSDQRMPEMTGSKFFEEALKIDAVPTRILLTGFADLEAVIEAVNSGQIWRYISKPWEPDDLLRTVKQASERTQMRRSLDESRLHLERALNHLRAKDWSRERLLQILLHEFRTMPQILEALKQFNENDPENLAIREKFLKQISLRLSVMEEDVRSLLSDEKSAASLPAQSFPLIPWAEGLCKSRKIKLQHEGIAAGFKIHAPQKQLEESLLHFVDIMAKNTGDVPPMMKIEAASKDNEAYLTLSLRGKTELKPKALAHLVAPVAWAALLEPFVGHEDLMHHSTGLRVETAHHVRLLSSLASRPDFSVSPDASRIDLVFSLRAI